ncbi:MAG TPA: quinonprotein alcohol dehydrogenase [Planctomycetes bacterium]|nr:quinonprotein alcohol dehydrogenase [Planctomycetota bacterium]
MAARSRRNRFAAALLAAAAVHAGDWPQFRGPRGDGNAAAADGAPLDLPLTWSEQENVVWKTSIPHRGWSTPVVLGGQVWVTTATTNGREFFVLCLDAERGAVRLDKKVFTVDEPEPLGNGVNCYASPSPAIEPGRVYVHFGSYGTACLDSETGDVLWERRDLPCRHYRGPGSSLALFRDLLIVTMDGVDVQYLAALDKKTGATIWKTDRTAEWNDLGPDGKPFDNGDLRKAYSTPLFAGAGAATEMLSVGARAAYGYDPLTGKELWKVRHGGYSNAASPVFGHGFAFIGTGSGATELWAVRPGGRGDVTATHVVWKLARGAPRIPSPVLAGDLLFVVDDGGQMTCLEAKTGAEVWRQRLGGEYAASLLHAAGRIYCFSQSGKTKVLAAGRAYDLLATNALDAGFMASPAVAGRALFLRTKTHLYRIEAPRTSP